MNPSDWCVALFGAAFLIAFVGFAYVRRQYGYWQANGVPYARPIRFSFGSIRGALRTEYLCDIFARYYTQFKGVGPFLGIYFLMRSAVLAVDIAFVKAVLVPDFAHFEARGVYYNERDDPLSAHMFAIEPTAWRRLRAKLTPTFTSGKMRRMFGTIAQVAGRFGAVLERQSADGAELEMRELLGRFTIDVIGTTAFGIECNCLEDAVAKFLRMGRKVLAEPRYHPLIVFAIDCFPRVARALRLKALPDDVGTLFMRIVRDTVAYSEQNGVRRDDFMDLLIRLKTDGDAPLTLNEIAAHAFVFFLAGFETSATTMTFALYELAANPQVQTQVRNEIAAVLQRHGGHFTYEAMMDMTYLEQAINEALRMYPPVPALTRQTIKPYHVPEYDYVIPAGVQVWIPSLAIHMDPEFYPNPTAFDPDRFGADQQRQRNPLTFLPFGQGPRNCIGIRFGMMQVRIGLVTLLRQFRFAIRPGRTTHPMQLSKTDFILSPAGGMWLDVQKISFN